jgi:hydrogenase maturation protease
VKRILIAGIGNIFLGDDAFGVETVRELARRPLPEGVRVTDFGIRSYDLAYALTDGYDVAILVDAAPRGGQPGTLYLIEPDIATEARENELPDGHSLNPVRVLRLAESLGGRPPLLYVVGCEPLDLGSEEGRMGLSDPVQAAVPGAVEMIESLLGKLLQEEIKTKAGLALA